MDKIKSNPSTQVDMPVIHEHNIVRLEANEVAELLDNVESGAKLTKHQAKVQKKLAVSRSCTTHSPAWYRNPSI